MVAEDVGKAIDRVHDISRCTHRGMYELHTGYEKLKSSLASGNPHARQMRKSRVQTPRFVGELMQGEIEVFANESWSRSRRPQFDFDLVIGASK